MKSENLYAAAEIIRSLTPYFFGSAGLVIILCAVLNSDRLAGDRFIYVLATAGPLLVVLVRKTASHPKRE